MAAVGSGCSLADAARRLGIPPETARGSAKRGKQESATPYEEFAEARERAAAVSMTHDECLRHVETAVRAGSVNWSRTGVK